MAEKSFSLRSLPARIIKAMMVAVVLPLAIGLLGSLLAQLELVSVGGASYREWVQYVGSWPSPGG